MRTFLLLIITLSFLNCKQDLTSSKETIFYVGTYTNQKSEGIYKYSIDDEGKFSKIGLVAKTNNPSFLVKSFSKKSLIAVDETDTNGTGFVKSYRITKDSLELLSISKSGGAHPCFLNTNDKNQLLVANYTGGNVGYLQLGKNGVLTQLLYIQQHTGKGTTDRQKAHYAHSVWFHPKTKEITSVDLGTNELWFSKINSSTDSFQPSSVQKFKMKDGSGPRHLLFHPKKNWIYVLNELNI